MHSAWRWSPCESASCDPLRASQTHADTFDLRRITILTVKFIPFFLITWYVKFRSLCPALSVVEKRDWCRSVKSRRRIDLVPKLRRNTGSSSTLPRHSSRRLSWSTSTSMAMRWYDALFNCLERMAIGDLVPAWTDAGFLRLAAVLPLDDGRQAHHVGSAGSTRPQLWRPHRVSQPPLPLLASPCLPSPPLFADVTLACRSFTAAGRSSRSAR